MLTALLFSLTVTPASAPELEIQIHAPIRTIGGVPKTPLVHPIQLTDRYGDFGVLIRNQGRRSLAVYCDGNSWGDPTLTFEFTPTRGKRVKIEKRIMAYSKNFPSMVVLKPGDAWLRPVLASSNGLGGWVGWPKLRAGETVDGTLVAVLSQSGTAGVWSGTVRSKPMTVQFLGSYR